MGCCRGNVGRSLQQRRVAGGREALVRCSLGGRNEVRHLLCCSSVIMAGKALMGGLEAQQGKGCRPHRRRKEHDRGRVHGVTERAPSFCASLPHTGARAGTSMASRFLRSKGIKLMDLREETVKLLGKADMYYFSPEHPPLTPQAQAALNWAIQEYEKRGTVPGRQSGKETAKMGKGGREGEGRGGRVVKEGMEVGSEGCLGGTVQGAAHGEHSK